MGISLESDPCQYLKLGGNTEIDFRSKALFIFIVDRSSSSTIFQIREEGDKSLNGIFEVERKKYLRLEWRVTEASSENWNNFYLLLWADKKPINKAHMSFIIKTKILRINLY